MSQSQPILTSIAAHLYVHDLGASLDFFTTKIGFTLDFIYGDPPFFAQVSRDKAHFALRHMDEPVFIAEIREREDMLSASITLATAGEINQLFRPTRKQTSPSINPCAPNPGKPKPSSSKTPTAT